MIKYIVNYTLYLAHYDAYFHLLFKFTYLKPFHILDLFDKLILPILNYGSEVWGFHKAPPVESVHMQFCKKFIGVKQDTQNDFIYGELGRMSLQSHRYVSILGYWLKIVSREENKYVKCIYKMMLSDIQNHPDKSNWASHVNDMLSKRFKECMGGTRGGQWYM